VDLVSAGSGKSELSRNIYVCSQRKATLGNMANSLSND
jgi:hypothetical protein